LERNKVKLAERNTKEEQRKRNKDLQDAQIALEKALKDRDRKKPEEN